ncbi:zinc finger protein 414 isoform X2 [Alosa alosa]|uniref:zinc finger protein 414 isoform X2 n=1 Tax=Alosa alosa TaxID=278164 RepID=UPI0020154FBF|nr:zinc finger protein 414 isoform X2 [Alosa alosa]
MSELAKLLSSDFTGLTVYTPEIANMSTDVKPAIVQSTNTTMPAGSSRASCTIYGCKRSYTDMTALNSHINDHQIPAESLPGKVFLCSSLGCDGSFSSMQQLMEHMRVHYKPNIFFICESCRAKLRSYRTLLKHLQTCAKVAKSKAARAGALGEQGPESELPTPISAPDPSEAYKEEDMETEISLPPAETPTAMGRSPDPLLSSSPKEAPAQSPSSVPQTSPSQPLSSPSPQSASAASNAVWRKNQGQSFSSRILWEHTRGRYNCLQCGHSTPNRKEMTTHIEGQHKSPSGKTSSETDGTESPTQLQSPSDGELSANTHP